MKINPSVTGLNQGKATPASGSERPGNAAGKPGSPPAQGDTIHLSDISAQLQALEATLSTGGEFDRTKVEAIKQAIREGRLSINPEVVADRMLASALAMMRKER